MSESTASSDLLRRPTYSIYGVTWMMIVGYSVGDFVTLTLVFLMKSYGWIHEDAIWTEGFLDSLLSHFGLDIRVLFVWALYNMHNWSFRWNLLYLGDT
jgi:hypothetical protein